jgi:two-component system NtrC family response regulator
MCHTLDHALSSKKYQIITATEGQKGIELTVEKEPSLVILGLKISDMNGIEVLKKIKEYNDQIPVVVITAFETIETAIKAMKIGATDYITKPFKLDELKLIIEKALHVNKLLEHVDYYRQELALKYGEMIGQSAAIKEINMLIHQVGRTNTTVMLTGENGTGKGVTAVAIHQQSDRANKPFVVVNCAALPEQLLESELFGHEKGAFTGAVSKKKGRFEVADSGTIFLDEIGALPINLQAKLLRVLQEKSFKRLGGNATIHIDVRVIAATNADLYAAVNKGTFREDLFYRLNVIRINIPPLRERKEDISLLVNHFIAKFNPAKKIKVSDEAMKILSNYNWPGNISELQNLIERASIVCQNSEIKAVDLPKELIESTKEYTNPILKLPDDGFSLADLEKHLIIKALEKHNYNQTQAAKYLGITRPTLLYRIQKYAIKPLKE